MHQGPGRVTEKDRDFVSWMVPGKWRAPQQHVDIIERQRLIDVMQQGQDRSLILINGPAGFGKTTLLRQWQQYCCERKQQVAWLTLDESDSDTRVLLCYLITALSAVGIELGRLPLLAEQGLADSPPSSVMGQLLNALSQQQGSEQIVLILDDFQRLQSKDATQLVNFLLLHMPPKMQLVIGCRNRPDLDLGLLRSQGRLLEIDADGLRFSTPEIRSLFGKQLTNEQFSQLHSKTEGWPVTLQLLRQSLEQGADSNQIIEAYSGTTDYLSEYLRQAIWQDCSCEVQRFLLETSILEQFDAGLAGAVSSVDNGFALIQANRSLSALLIPLDEHGSSLRYHHLFADFLLGLLNEQAVIEKPVLYLRASNWSEQQGKLLEAVRYAGLANDFERAASLIEFAGGWALILYGGIGFLRQLLNCIPDTAIALHPRLQVAKGYLCQKDGQIKLARTYLDAAFDNPVLNSYDTKALKQFDRDSASVLILQNTYEDNLTDSYDHLARSRKRIPEEDALFHGVSSCACALNMMAEAHFEKGIAHVRTAVQQMRKADSVLGTNYCYLHLGTLAFYQGQFRQADAYFAEAQAMADENFGSDSGLKYLADILLFALRDWQAFPQEDTERFLHALQHVEQFDGWYEIYVAAYEVLLWQCIADNDVDLLRTLIQRSQAIVKERNSPRMQIFVASCELLLALLDKDELAGEQALRQYGNQHPHLLNPDRWNEKPIHWRPLQHFGIVLARWYRFRGDIDLARTSLEALEAQCKQLICPPLLVTALVQRAELEFEAKNNREATQFLYEAATLAWPENIKRPFLRCNQLLAMVSACQVFQQHSSIDRLALNFLQQCVQQAKRMRSEHLAKQELLSGREMEALLLLAEGLSNKEIARDLDMTVHTVKFHLKNIYNKLGVTKRTNAVLAAREQGLL